jgi:TonB family protein
MSPFLLYVGRSSLYLAIFYAFFLLVMRRTSLFRFNRTALLAGSAVCFVLPLVRLRTEAAAQAAAGPLTAVAAAAEPLSAPATTAFGPWLLLLYVAGAAAVLSFTAVAAVRMLRTIRSGRTIDKDGCKLTILNRDVPSFSWGRHIVISLKDYVNSPSILTHEMMHVDRHHSLDILFFTAVTVLHWFNPLAWITLSELKLLHEYEADEAVIDKGIDATQYQLLLVKKAVGEHRFSLANGFQHSKLKNRINMMLKKQTPGWMRLAYLLLLPVLAGAMFACNPSRQQEPDPVSGQEQLETKAADEAVTEEVKVQVKEMMDKGEAVPFQLLEDKPTFNGSDAGKFSEWVNSNLIYPEAAKAAGEQGRVVLQFTIDPEGNLVNARVLRGVSEALDAESLRVISNSPKWEPGRVDGKPVSVTYTFPIVFQLK